MEEAKIEVHQYELLKPEEKTAVIIASNEREGLLGTLAKDGDYLTLRNVIKVAVSKAYFSTGRPLAIKDGTFIIDELRAEVIRVFPSIRIEEIGLAIHRGAMAEYGIVYNLSLATFVGFIRTYLNSENRIQAIKSHMNALLLEEKIKPSEEEIAKMTKQNVLNAYEFYKVNQYFNDYGNSIFTSLVEYGGIVNFTDDQKDEIWKNANHNVFKELTSRSRSMDERAQKKRTLEEVKATKFHPLVFTEAKKIALNMVFKDMAEMGLDINDMISPA